MKPLAALSRLLTMLAVIGLVLGVVSPVDAGPRDDAAAMMAMPDGMPPCDEKPIDCRDSKSCPFQALCAAKLPQGTPSAPSAAAPEVTEAVNLAPDYAGRIGLIRPPPAPPPKT